MSSMHAVLGGGKVADILLWENKILSGGILGGVTAIWVLFEVAGFPFVTFFCHILMLSMIILFTWSKSAGLIKRNPPTFNDMLPESAFRFFSDQINQLLLAFYDTSVGGRGLKTFFVTLAGLYILSFVGSLLSTLTFTYLVFASCATLPALYEKNKMQVDEFFGHSYQEINNSFGNFRSQLVNMIPAGKND